MNGERFRAFDVLPNMTDSIISLNEKKNRGKVTLLKEITYPKVNSFSDFSVEINYFRFYYPLQYSRSIPGSKDASLSATTFAPPHRFILF